MPRRTPPVPLSGAEQTRYDDLYDLFGREDADKFAFGVTKDAAPPPESERVVPAAPSVQLPPAAVIATGPVGTRPPMVAIPDVTDKLIYRQSLEELKASNEAAQVKRIKELTTMYGLTGLSTADADARARKEVYSGIEQPRTVEYGSKPVKPGTASDFAARGVELAPRLDTARTVIEAFKPQVLESEQQAAGRKRFGADTQRATAMLQAEAEKTGLTVNEVAKKMQLNNELRAPAIAKQTFGATYTVANLKQVEDMLNAPLYAAVDELGKSVFAPLTEIPGKVFRGLTETELQGQRVETKPAAVMRGIAGLSRLALGGIKAGIMDPISKGVIAASEGIPVMEVDARLQRDRARQGGASQTVSVNPLGAPIPVGPRSRIDSGDWLKDTAYEIATGRSAVDDYIDLGFNPQVALVTGIATEFLMPQSPVGWITDVAPALGAGKAVAKAGQIAGDAAKAPALYQFFADTARSAADVGLVLEKPTFWKTLTRAADVRTKVATELAQELTNVAYVDKLAADASKMGNEKAKTILVEAIDDLMLIPKDRLPPTTAKIVDELLASGADLTRAEEILPVLQKLLRGDKDNPGIVTKIKSIRDDAAADIVSNAYAVAIKNPGSEAGFEATVRAAVAETLEKVPDNGWAFMTPSLIVKKSVMADRAFQTGISEAVRLLPDGASMTDVQKTIETTAKEFLKGKGSLAEPVALTPGRAESFLPSFPRGGLERLGTPGSRRAPVVEAAQDTLDFAKVVTDNFLRGKKNPAARVSDSFAGSQTANGIDNTLESALKTRMPATTRNMIEKTRSEILSLGVNKTSVNPLKGGAESGTLIDAIRAQGSLDGYLTARIEADIAGSGLKASTHTSPVAVTPLKDLPAVETSDVIKGIVDEFFGTGPQGIGFIVTPNIQRRLTAIVKKAVKTSDTAVEAVTQSILNLRKDFPELKEVGRRSPGTLEDDVAGSALNYIIGSESKKIYTDNFFEAYPELYTPATTDAIRLRIESELIARQAPADEIGAILQTWDEVFEDPEMQKSFAKEALKIAKKQFGQNTFDYSIAPVVDTTKVRKALSRLLMIGDASRPPSPQELARKIILIDAVDDATQSSIDALTAFATNSKLIRPINEQDVLAVLAKGTSLPIGSSEKMVFESLIGNVDDLAKGTASISDNLQALRRNPEALSYVSSGIRGVINQVRNLSLSGMTAGVTIPNPKFFAMNYFGMGPMIAITAPEIMVRTMGAEFGLPGTVRLHSVMAAAENPQIANKVAFTSTNGVPYTNKQLADFLDNNYFGMTEKDFSLGTKIGEDVRIAVGEASSGMKGEFAAAMKDKVLRYLNVNGTNIFSRYASQVDINFRKQAFLNALKVGEAPNIAQRTASNAVFDYGRIPPELRKSISKYISFMSFMAMSNAELLSVLVRPAAMKNLSKTINFQRELNRGYLYWDTEDESGATRDQWDFASDADKQRMYSIYLGQDDKMPTYFVGPASPLMGPLVDDVQLGVGMANIAEQWYDAPGVVKPSVSAAAQVIDGSIQILFDKMFTPAIGYASNIGLIGDKKITTAVPAQQIYFHQSLGKEHFGEWMREMGVQAVDYKERKVGGAEFYGEQYEFVDEAAVKRAQGLEFLYVLGGIGRSITDLQKGYAAMGMKPPFSDVDMSGVDMKRYGNNKAMFLLQYGLGGNLKKGSPEYEFYYQGLRSGGFELAPR